MDIINSGIDTMKGMRQPQFAKTVVSIRERQMPMITNAMKKPRVAVV